jgi:hypothetical protein
MNSSSVSKEPLGISDGKTSRKKTNQKTKSDRQIVRKNE